MEYENEGFYLESIERDLEGIRVRLELVAPCMLQHEAMCAEARMGLEHQLRAFATMRASLEARFRRELRAREIRALDGQVRALDELARQRLGRHPGAPECRNWTSHRWWELIGQF